MSAIRGRSLSFASSGTSQPGRRASTAIFPAFGSSRSKIAVPAWPRDALDPAAGPVPVARQHRAASQSGDIIMATIGHFTQDAAGFSGTIETLSCPPAPVRLVPVEAKPNAAAPDLRVYRGDSEIGAAWAKLSKSGRRFHVVTLDDPAFSRPIECRLVAAGAGFVLMWSR
jgi:uncharacterized protein (DUF736 family)